MKRREFIGGLGLPEAVPLLAAAQERRLVAFLHSGSRTPPHDGLSQGLVARDRQPGHTVARRSQSQLIADSRHVA